MRAVAIVLACLACAGQGRRLQSAEQQTSSEEPAASDALAKFLLAFNAAAPTRTTELGRARSAAVRMADAAPKAKAKPKAKGKAKAKAKAEPEPVLMSQAMPFLTRRASLGPVGKYVGDLGFDPLGFSEYIDLRWLREAEIKHCRVCMLAFVGFAFTDFYHFPGFDFTTIDAHDACVEQGSMSQLLLWIGILEVIGGFITVDQMFRGSGREPGDFGFDPLGFATDPEIKKDLQMKELANGRLAMFAFSGAVTQAVLTGNTFPWLYGDATTAGSGGDFAWNIVP